MTRPLVAITMGDPAGVGAEIIAKSLVHEHLQRSLRPLVVGDALRLEQAVRLTKSRIAVRRVTCAEEAKFESRIIDCIHLGIVPENLPFGQLSSIAGEAAYQFIAKAVELTSAEGVQAICTAPINKEALHAAGHRFPGHTELLAHLTGTPEVSMMLVAPGLRVIHVTTHVGLLEAVARIEPRIVERTIVRGAEVLRRSGIGQPRIGVCGINPHAGENGLFGHHEEEHKIIPAVQACRAKGWNVQGPLPADTLFWLARRGDFDLVVAMYHDQGHGPVKVLGLDVGVNVTIGLPFVRTSVDHGTAFDIAGTGRASEGSMVEALRQAVNFSPALAGPTTARST